MPLYNYLDIARGALELTREGEALPGDLPHGDVPHGDLPPELRDYLVELAQALQRYGISLGEPRNWPVVLALTLFYARMRPKRSAQPKTTRVRTC